MAAPELGRQIRIVPLHEWENGITLRSVTASKVWQQHRHLKLKFRWNIEIETQTLGSLRLPAKCQHQRSIWSVSWLARMLGGRRYRQSSVSCRPKLRRICVFPSRLVKRADATNLFVGNSIFYVGPILRDPFFSRVPLSFFFPVFNWNSGFIVNISVFAIFEHFYFWSMTVGWSINTFKWRAPRALYFITQ